MLLFVCITSLCRYISRSAQAKEIVLRCLSQTWLKELCSSSPFLKCLHTDIVQGAQENNDVSEIYSFPCLTESHWLETNIRSMNSAINGFLVHFPLLDIFIPPRLSSRKFFHVLNLNNKRQQTFKFLFIRFPFFKKLQQFSCSESSVANFSSFAKTRLKRNIFICDWNIFFVTKQRRKARANDQPIRFVLDCAAWVHARAVFPTVKLPGWDGSRITKQS